MRLTKLLFIILAAITFISCEPTYEKEYSWAYPLAGDWKLIPYVDGAEIGDAFEIKIYNSSFGQDSIWIDDYATTSSNGHFWSMKFKAKANMTAKTFESTGSTNAIVNYGIAIKLSNGKVIGNDSITMDVEFGDDAGTIYQLKGHRIVSYDDYMGGH
jgi:hypothetical protein